MITQKDGVFSTGVPILKIVIDYPVNFIGI